ncbi:MAG: hypothetical protein KDA99_05375, partial [Planctomycetales bacterium]|nr:hypothetical protein [Planctomycetales bacterium]
RIADNRTGENADCDYELLPLEIGECRRYGRRTHQRGVASGWTPDNESIIMAAVSSKRKCFRSIADCKEAAVFAQYKLRRRQLRYFVNATVIGNANWPASWRRGS